MTFKIELPDLAKLTNEELTLIHTQCRATANLALDQIRWNELNHTHKPISRMILDGTNVMARPYLRNSCLVELAHPDDRIEFEHNGTSFSIKRGEIDRLVAVLSLLDFNIVRVLNFHKVNQPPFSVFIRRLKDGLVIVGHFIEDVNIEGVGA